jgi:hypothetical protein
VDVGECSWRGRPLSAGTPGGPAAAVRVECVAAHGSRAVRIRRGTAAGADELRAVATVTGGETVVALVGNVAGAIPLSLAFSAAGVDEAPFAAGDGACLSGEFDAVVERGQSRGRALGLVDGIDLAAATAEAAHRTSGVAAVRIDRLVWEGGRIGGSIGRLEARGLNKRDEGKAHARAPGRGICAASAGGRYGSGAPASGLSSSQPCTRARMCARSSALST